MSSNESSTNDSSNPQSSPAAIKGNPSHKSLYILAALMAVAGAAVYFVPKVLVNIYLAEEEAKRKANVVGSRTDVEIPPGMSDPYRGMPGRGGEAPAEKPADE